MQQCCEFQLTHKRSYIMVEIKDLKIGMKVRITSSAWITKAIGKIGIIENIDKGDNTIKVSIPDEGDWWWFDLNELEHITHNATVEELEKEVELAETAVND